MFSRINVKRIIVAHVKTLRSLNQPVESNRIYWKDIMTFLCWPAIISYSLCLMHLNLMSQVSNLIAIISIFGGFLFNLLAIIYSYIDKIKSSFVSGVRKRFAYEINANISFCILLSIFNILLLLIFALMPNKPCYSIIKFAGEVLTYSIYYTLILFFLTLLMVLSRVFVLLQKESE